MSDAALPATALLCGARRLLTVQSGGLSCGHMEQGQGSKAPRTESQGRMTVELRMGSGKETAREHPSVAADTQQKE